MKKLRDFDWQYYGRVLHKHRKWGFFALPPVFLFLVLSSGNNKEAVVAAKKEPSEMGVIAAGVDARANWTAKIAAQVEGIRSEMEKREQELIAVMEKSKRESEELRREIVTLRREKTTKPVEVQVQQPVSVPVKKAALIHGNERKPKISDNSGIIPAGSFAPAVLTTGMIIKTGTASPAEPMPVLMRITGPATFSKERLKAKIEDAVIYGSCTASLSEERAVCRLEKMTWKNDRGEFVTRKVEGWINSARSGKMGVSGGMVDRSNEAARNAAMAGMLAGLSDFAKASASASVFPVSPISGPSKALTGGELAKSAGASGVGDGLKSYVDWLRKRAELMDPVLDVDPGIVVDVIFKEGVDLNSSDKSNDHGGRHEQPNTTNSLSAQSGRNPNMMALGKAQARDALNDIQGSM